MRLIALFEWAPMFVLIADILGWVTEALPDVTGIAMVIGGDIANALLDNLTGDK